MTRAERRRLTRAATNQANAQHSTGPVTEEGKAASSRNALKHGLTALQPCLAGEEQAYEKFVRGMLRHFRPQDPHELQLIQTWIDLQWRLRRVPAVEARLLEQLIGAEDADAARAVRSLDNLSRHENRLRRQADALLAEFKALAASRPTNAEAGAAEWQPSETESSQFTDNSLADSQFPDGGFVLHAPHTGSCVAPLP